MRALSSALAAACLTLPVAAQGSYAEALTSIEGSLTAGDFRGAAAAAEDALARFEENPTLAYARASAAALGGDLDGAVRWLERAVVFGFEDSGLARWDPRLAALRADGRLEPLLSAIEDEPTGAPALEIVAAWSTERPWLDAEREQLEVGPWERRCVLDLETRALVSVKTDGCERVRENEYATPDGRRYVSSDTFRKWAAVWNRDDDRVVWRISSPDRRIVGASYLDPSTVAVGWRDGCIELRDAESGDRRETIRGLGLGCQLLGTFGSEALAVTDDGTLWSVDLAATRVTRAIESALTWPRSIDASESSGLVAVDSLNGTGSGAGVVVFDLERDRVACALESERSYGLDARGERLLVGDDTRIRVHDARSGEILFELPIVGVNHACWDPRGARIATVRGDTVEVWDARSGERRLEFLIDLDSYGQATALAFDPVCDRLAVGGSDAKARIYSLEDGALLHTLDHAAHMFMYWADKDSITDVSFDTSGERLVTATASWVSVSCWDADSGTHLWHAGGGGNPTTLEARFVRADTLVHVSIGWNTLLDASDGRVVGLPDGVASWRSVFVGERWFVEPGRPGANGFNGFVVRDTETYALRFVVTPCSRGDSIVRSPQGYVTGTARALREAQVLVDDVAWPVDSFAPVLFDPRRLQAAAAGVALRAPRLPAPPELREVRPPGRWLAGDAPNVEVEAVGGQGAKRLELVVDGRRIEAAGSEVSQHGDATRFAFRAGPELVPAGATLELRVVDARGFQSRIHRVGRRP